MVSIHSPLKHFLDALDTLRVAELVEEGGLPPAVPHLLPPPQVSQPQLGEVRVHLLCFNHENKFF